MDIGELNRRIDVLQFQTFRDEFGGEVGEWVAVGRVWANIKPGLGTEHFVMDKPQAETATTITMRFYPALNVMHRIRYEEKLYKIICVADDNTAHRMTIATANELTANEL